MKKFIFVFFVLFISCVVMISCTDTKYLAVKNCISEDRQNVFVGETENFKVDFMTGKRESDYKINGYKTELIEFGVVTFTIKNQDLLNSQNLYCSVFINDKKYDELLEKNPFNNTFVADIKTVAQDLDSIIVELKNDNFSEKCVLKNLNSNWKTNGEKALHLTYKQYKSKLKKLVKDSQFEGEVYIKILNNTTVSSDKYLWYVNIVTRTGKNFACIIDTDSNKILAKRENTFSL